MDKNILYYPNIEFKFEDYKWLWSASLLWDKIYRIVPDNYTLNEPRNILEICSSGEIGIPISPIKYSKKASSEFISKINTREWRASALEFNTEDVDKYEEYCRIHKDKIDVVLRNIDLVDKCILEDQEDEDWLYISKDMANLYMTFLAKTIASQNNLSLNTHNADIWTASTYFLYDNQIQDGYYPGEDYIESSNEALVSIFIKDIIPENILHISPKRILEFREKRRDERKQFIQALDSFSNKLSSVSDENILSCIINDEQKEVEYALNQYKESMDILKAIKWSGSVSALITIATDALGYTSFNSNVIKGLTSAGIGLNLITGLLEKKTEQRNTPYSYLTQMRKIIPNEFNDYSNVNGK